jgi:hypothetical protein
MKPLRSRPAFLAALVLAIVLAGCGGDDDDDPTATTQTGATATIDTPASTVSAGSIASDGICQIQIPDTWVDDGTGRGLTEQGDRWSLFGGSISSDEDWTAARDLLKAQVAHQEGVEITEGEDEIIVTRPNGQGIVVRRRFDETYCELAITSRQDRSPDVTASWQTVLDSMAPIESE